MSRIIDNTRKTPDLPKKFGWKAAVYWISTTSVVPAPLAALGILSGILSILVPLIVLVMELLLWIRQQSETAQWIVAWLLAFSPIFAIVVLLWRRHRRWVVEETINQFDRNA
jgi:hypothetical protein